MGEVNGDKSLCVQNVHDPDAFVANSTYYTLAVYLAEHRGKIFDSDDAKGNNYVAALKSGARKPNFRFFSKKSALKSFLRTNPLSAGDYRYYEEMEWMI